MARSWRNPSFASASSRARLFGNRIVAACAAAAASAGPAVARARHSSAVRHPPMRATPREGSIIPARGVNGYRWMCIPAGCPPVLRFALFPGGFMKRLLQAVLVAILLAPGACGGQSTDDVAER